MDNTQQKKNEAQPQVQASTNPVESKSPTKKSEKPAEQPPKKEALKKGADVPKPKVVDTKKGTAGTQQSQKDIDVAELLSAGKTRKQEKAKPEAKGAAKKTVKTSRSSMTNAATLLAEEEAKRNQQQEMEAAALEKAKIASEKAATKTKSKSSDESESPQSIASTQPVVEPAKLKQKPAAEVFRANIENLQKQKENMVNETKSTDGSITYEVKNTNEPTKNFVATVNEAQDSGSMRIENKNWTNESKDSHIKNIMEMMKDYDEVSISCVCNEGIPEEHIHQIVKALQINNSSIVVNITNAKGIEMPAEDFLESIKTTISKDVVGSQQSPTVDDQQQVNTTSPHF